VIDVEPREAMTLGDRFDEVVAAARGGEEWALRAIYEELAPRVRGYLRGQGEAEPDELVGEVFLQVVRDLARFEGDEAALRAWVLTIAHDRLVGEQRRRSRRLSVSVVRAGRGGDPEERAADASEEARVNAILGGLSSSQRSVVLLRALGELSVGQVADVLGKSPRAVERIQRRGLAVLARHGEPGPETADESVGRPADSTEDRRDRETLRLTAERAAELSGLLDSLVARARHMQRESEAMIDAAEEALAELRTAARAPSYPGPSREPGREQRMGGFEPSPADAELKLSPPIGRAPEPREGIVQPIGERRAEARVGSGREEALLRATQMAIRGRSRAEIEAKLREELGVPRPAEIVDQILGAEQE